MKSIIIVLLAGLFVTGCGGNSSTDSITINKDTIIGTWDYIYASSQCREINIFNSDNTFSVNSLDEIQTGEYAIEPPSGSVSRYKVTMKVLTDNGLSSCSGSTTDSTGQVMIFYAEFTTADQIVWYINSSGGSPLGAFNRVS